MIVESKMWAPRVLRAYTFVATLFFLIPEVIYGGFLLLMRIKPLSSHVRQDGICDGFE